MPDKPLARVRLSPSSPPLDVVYVEPSGETFKVTLLQDGRHKRLPAHALIEAIDADTGEILGHPLDYFRAIWARKVCGPEKRWPLPDLINALAIKGLGPQYAQKIAAAMGTWEQFRDAIAQLRTIEVPSSRDDIEYLRFEAGIKQGLVDTETTEHRVQTKLGEIVFHTSISQSTGSTTLPAAYPQPLAKLMDAAGPAMWRALRDWADSPRSADDVRALMQFGSPSEYAAPGTGGAMAGMTFVFTGTLASMSREEAYHAVEQMGGRVRGSVTESTTALVAGAESERGAKLHQAAKHDVDVWTEAQFLAAIGHGKLK